MLPTPCKRRLAWWGILLGLAGSAGAGLAAAPPSPVAGAEEPDTSGDQEEQRRLTLDFGYRWRINFDGSEELYRSQLDYGQGPKLFGADFFQFNPGPGKSFFDRLEFRLNNWGGEPYSSAQFHMARNGVYDFQFTYQRVRYFNSIPSFANPFFELGVETQRRFDTTQRHAQFSLTLRPGKRVSPFFSYRRSGRRGLVRTTLSADGDEFQITSDTDNHSNDFGGGVELAFKKFSLRLEQGIRLYRDGTEYSATGFQEGNSTRVVLGHPINLTDYQGREDARVNAPYSTAAAVFKPHPTITLRTRHSYTIADTDSNYSESIAGSFFNFPDLRIFYEDASLRTPAQSKKPSWYGDFSAEWKPSERFRLIERFRTRRFHISGAATILAQYRNVEPAAGGVPRDLLEDTEFLNSFLSVDIDKQELEGRFYPTRRTFFRVGHRHEHKVVKSDSRFSQDRDVLVLGGGYEFSSTNRIGVDYEYGTTNQPVERVDAIDFHRLRINGRMAPISSLHLEGLVTLFDHDDDLDAIDLTSRDRNYALRFSFDPSRRFSLSGGFERSSFRNDALYLMPQTISPDRSVYREKGNYADLTVTVYVVGDAFLELGYAFWGTSGTFPLSAHRPVARLEVPLAERLSFYGQWNYYGYNEKESLFPADYRTHLVVAGLRISLDPFRRWNQP